MQDLHTKPCMIQKATCITITQEKSTQTNFTISLEENAPEKYCLLQTQIQKLLYSAAQANACATNFDSSNKFLDFARNGIKNAITQKGA